MEHPEHAPAPPPRRTATRRAILIGSASLAAAGSAAAVVGVAARSGEQKVTIPMLAVSGTTGATPSSGPAAVANAPVADPRKRAAHLLRRAGFGGSPAEFEAYYDRPHVTLAGDLTVGDYARPLKARSLPSEQALRLLYAFHHGARLEAGGPALDAVTRLGAAAKALGCPVVAYETPLSVETGERVLGPEFRAVVEHNFAVMRAAFAAGAGEQSEILKTGMSFAEAEFIDPTDGSEHLGEAGRRRLAALLADAVRAQYGS